MTLRQRQPPLRDPAYRASFATGHFCLNCGTNDNTIVGAHIRWGHEAGVGLKPSDDLIVPLCFKCHADQEANPGPEYWANMVKKTARRTYRVWRLEQEDV